MTPHHHTTDMAMGVKERVKEGSKAKPTRAFSDKQEKSIANALGGRQTANSGATPWQKGDVLTKEFLIEAKTKTSASESISLKKEWFIKNNYEASEMGKKYTALVFNFGPGEENHYVIDEWLFKELLEYLENKHEQ